VSIQMMITVPEKTLQLAQSVSDLTGIPVEQIISNLLDESLPLIPPPDPSRPVVGLPDSDLMALSNITMQPEANKRHLELLGQLGEGVISESGRIELQRLQQVYEIALLYKAQAMVEASKRGLLKV